MSEEEEEDVFAYLKSIFISEYPAHYVTQSTNNEAQRLIHYKIKQCFWTNHSHLQTFPNIQTVNQTNFVCVRVQNSRTKSKGALQCMRV